MYVVRRAFRGPNGPMSVGSFVEPADLRRFRYHLQEKHIVEVNEQNLEQYASLFKRRFNIDLVGLIAEKQAAEEAEAKAAEEAAKAEAEAKAAEEAAKAEAEAKAAEEAAKAEAEAKAAEEAAKPKATAKTTAKAVTTKTE